MLRGYSEGSDLTLQLQGGCNVKSVARMARNAVGGQPKGKPVAQGAMRTDAAAPEPRRVAEQFASRVQKLRSVVRVVAQSLPDGLSVWTMMDGDTDGRARR